MDYRSRHPHLHIWPRRCLRAMRPPAHYGEIGATGVAEVNAPDGTEFLAVSGGLRPDERYGTLYLVEAAKSCDQRMQLEAGKLSWIDFWNHRGWLLFIKFEMGSDSDVLATYIPSSALISHQVERFTKLGMISPYELKLRSLEFLLDISVRWKERGSPEEDVEGVEREYREFVAKYWHKIPSLNGSPQP